MPLPFQPASPDTQVVRVRVMDAHVDLTAWTQYTFHSHMLKPTEGWSCTVGDGNLAKAERDALSVGARVRLYVDNTPLAEGFIDQVEIQADRGSGTTYSIHGRNRLGLTVDAGVDPTVQFKDGATLIEVLRTLFAPFGWVSEEHFVSDNAVNRDAKTGGIRGIPTTKGGKKKGPRPLKSFVTHQLKPHDHEGVYELAKRIAERHGLMLWCTADGEKLIVSTPNFEQEPRYQLFRTPSDGTNVLAGTVSFDGTDQPSVIVADGFAYGTSEFGPSPLKAVCVNPYFGVDKDGFVTDEVSEVLKKYSSAHQITTTVQPYRRRALGAPMRPVYLHDNESKTQDQLNNFVRRKMSELLRKSMVAHYTVEGHAQVVGGARTFWDVDTVVHVRDDVAGVDERMYVVGRTFEKSRSAGTRTELELIRLNTIELGDQPPEVEAAPPATVSRANHRQN